jgi:hypothetical protein
MSEATQEELEPRNLWLHGDGFWKEVMLSKCLLYVLSLKLYHRAQQCPPWQTRSQNLETYKPTKRDQGPSNRKLQLDCCLCDVFTSSSQFWAVEFCWLQRVISDDWGNAVCNPYTEVIF